jgi:CRP-like cAMP-binding protein
MRFDVYNAGEWVLRKGMLNENFFIVALGVLQILLDDGTEHEAGRRRMSSSSLARVDGTSLKNAVVAEVTRGEVVGEQSASTKGKCETSVRAKGSVELLIIPRETMRRLTERNRLIKSRLHKLKEQRVAENLFLTTGKQTMAGGATTILLIKGFVKRWRARMERKRAAEAAAADPNASAAAAASSSGANTPPPTADGAHPTPPKGLDAIAAKAFGTSPDRSPQKKSSKTGFFDFDDPMAA